jgi:hypothetical protein
VADKVYRIPESNLDSLKTRLVKMNRRAAKLKMSPVVLTETGEDFDLLRERDRMFDAIDNGCVGPRWKIIKRELGETIEQAQTRATLAFPNKPKVFTLRRFVLCTVTGSLPRVDGWAMAATIEHDEGGNILRTVPGVDEPLPLKYRTAGTLCEHCNTDRRRNDTYVLQHEAGNWKQVGRNCLADFIRSTDAGAWADAAEMLANLDAEVSAFEGDDFEGGGGSGAIYYRAVELLTQVACLIRSDGWCSRTEAKNTFGKQSTADHALCFFDSKYVNKLSTKDREKYTSTQADHDRASEAIAWAQELPTDVSNDYLWNIRVVSHRENLTYRDAGLAASIISAYIRHLEQELKRKHERETTLDEHFGEIGKRDVYTLTVTGLREIDGNYGLTTLYLFRDADGRTAKWFASGSGGFKIGQTIIAKATIKGHDVYNGMKQTMLSRVVVYDAEAEAAQKEAVKAAKKLIKKQYVCTHEDQTWVYSVPAGVSYIDVRCCRDCQDAWVAQESPKVQISEEVAA